MFGNTTAIEWSRVSWTQMLLSPCPAFQCLDTKDKQNMSKFLSRPINTLKPRCAQKKKILSNAYFLFFNNIFRVVHCRIFTYFVIRRKPSNNRKDCKKNRKNLILREKYFYSIFLVPHLPKVHSFLGFFSFCFWNTFKTVKLLKKTWNLQEKQGNM